MPDHDIDHHPTPLPASATAQPIAESALGIVQLFSRIIGFRMDRDAAVQREVRRVFHLP